MPLVPEDIMFGLANIYIGADGADQIKFDGNEYFQAEGGEITFEPSWETITVKDLGNDAYDERLVGLAVNITIAAASENIKMLRTAMRSYTQSITDTTTSEEVGFGDGKIGASARSTALPVRIHPRNKPEGDTSGDYNIYLMNATGAFTRTYDLAQGNVAISLKAYPRDNADALNGFNYFYMGGVDPNSQA
jgi:hypothetical protein